jgi:chromosomal replication initiator protein
VAEVQDAPEPPSGASSGQAAWARVKSRLRAELGEDIYSSWFARMDLDAVDDRAVRLTVPTRFLKSWIQSHYIERMLGAWRAELSCLERIEVDVRSAVIRSMAKSKGEACVLQREPATPAADLRKTQAAAATAGHTPAGSPLDPRLTFDTFVLGRCNRLAQAAARQVSTGRASDPVVFNPLYIHAGVGLGKTHLLQAIAWGCPPHADRKVLYLTAEKFIYGFVSALQNHTAIAFKEALRGINVLLIDDLQFLQGKSTQAEFCHTLDALMDAGQQVVVAADRPPADLESLNDRVRSRLAGGLVVEMGSLEEEVRLEILKARVGTARQHHPGFDVPPAVLAFVAKSITHNGRDLDGALNRLLAHSQLTGHAITMEMAEAAVRDLIRPQEPKRVKIEDIQRTVARHYNVSRADMLSSRRTANVVRPRQVAMYLSKTLTLRSLPEIGRRFGGRDHTTVLHAVRKIENLADTDQALADEIELLKRLLLE